MRTDSSPYSKINYRKPILDSCRSSCEASGTNGKIRSRTLFDEAVTRTRETLHRSIVAFALAILLTFFFIHHEVVNPVAFLDTFSVTPTSTSSILTLPGVSGITMYKLPPRLNRFHVPWFRPPSVRLPTPQQSNYRFLYSPTRRGSSDGIGHSMGAVNYEFNIALRFNLTYTHRLAFYSSLTRNDRYAVERFFGWGEEEIPRTFIQTDGCHPRNGSWPSAESLYDCHVCDAPLTNGSLHIKHLVTVPVDLGASCRTLPDCDERTAAFLAKHPHSHTVFQLSESICSPPATDPVLVRTKNLFFHKYWRRHGQLPWASLTRPVELRPVRYQTHELNIALHVRRGDFLTPEGRERRKITDDYTFAKMLQDVISTVHMSGGPFASAPIAIHVYSEGRLTKERVLSTHDMTAQDKFYYNSAGERKNERWWQQLVFGSRIAQSLPGVVEAKKRTRFLLHISEDTLQSAHEMVSADVFIGSLSGMSIYLIWSMSRGITIVPHSGSTGLERRSQGGPVCCSVPFDNSNGNFSTPLFQLYWRAYITANEHSLYRSTKDAAL